MNEKTYRAHGAKPFCRCCGSRDVVTLEKVLENSPASKWTAAAKRAELWRCINELSVSETWEFIDDAFGFMLIEDIGDLQSELGQQLIEECGGMRSCTKLDSAEPISKNPVDLADIGQVSCSVLIGERKRGFLRIWNSFSRVDKLTFLFRVMESSPNSIEVASLNPGENLNRNRENLGDCAPKPTRETPSIQAKKKDGGQ